MVDLIPTASSVMRILSETGAYRYGHFVSNDGRHSSHYFKLPISFHYSDNARVLAVGLSRKFRVNKMITRELPNVAIVSPSADGIPVAFGIRDALTAAQIFWADRDNGKTDFPDYLSRLKVEPCIIVDDIVKTGSVLRHAYEQLTELGAKVIGFGSIVKFRSASSVIEGLEIQSLVDFDSPIYENEESWTAAEGNDAPVIQIEDF